MPLHPKSKFVLDQLEAAGGLKLDLEELRKPSPIGELAGHGPEMAREEDLAIPGVAGEIPIRIYTPVETPDPLPLALWFHGGGWSIGSIDETDAVCRQMAAAGPAMVVSVGYRLAPENRFPAGLEDCYAATCWAHEHATEIGGDPTRLAVIGESAGGNLAAATALRARAEGRPTLALQVLVCPALSTSLETPSAKQFDGYFLTCEAIRWCWDNYLGSGDGWNDPLAAPALASSLEGLPSALIITAEFDPLRDDGEGYGARLAEVGVPTTVRRFDGMIHGFFPLVAYFESAVGATREIGAALRHARAVAASG